MAIDDAPIYIGIVLVDGCECSTCVGEILAGLSPKGENE